MDKGLRLLGETLCEGLAIGTLKTEDTIGGKSVRFEYINPVLNKWLGVQESIHLRLNGLDVLMLGEMAELYQISELEEAISSDTPVTYKVFCEKLGGFLEVLAWKSGPDQFVMMIRNLFQQVRETEESKPPGRINRFQAEAGLKFLIDNMADVLWRLDDSFRFTYISASDVAMRGYENDEVIGHTLWEFITPESAASLRRYHQEVVTRPIHLQNGDSVPKEIQMICKDGRMIWVEVNLTPVLNSSKRLDGYQGVARDVSRNREAQASLLEYRRLMEAVLDNMAQAMIVINSRMEIAAYNKKFMDLFGFEASELKTGSSFETAFRLWRQRRPNNRETMEMDIASIRTNRSYTREYWQKRHTEDEIWVQLFHNPLPGGGFVRTYSDITDRKLYEMDLCARSEKLAVIAATDELTGVLNRRSGFSMLSQMEKLCAKQQKTFSICYLDIDGLKQVNDQYGHGEGDVVLKTVAGLIRSAIRTGDAICRIGGDEFMILFPGCEKCEAERLVQSIKEELVELSADMGKPYVMSFSFGIEQKCAEDSIPLEELIRQADHLMYLEKNVIDEISS